ncbi:unnamed protein product [Prunus armeniaca]|uniref:Uncharacterized protein n=1 Tax=Prunus armeniaca TaxID=36596 RepID=A0A6J5VCN9_PRUAR|nr:unnamed protein product [Prunus armeniaca]
MSCLIRTPEDVSFLCDKKIVENYLGTDEEVVHFFKNLGKGVVFDINKSYLRNSFKEVNEYHRNTWHVRWEGFRSKYFGTPWSFLSAVAAVILLLLTAIQAFFAVYGLPIRRNWEVLAIWGLKSSNNVRMFDTFFALVCIFASFNIFPSWMCINMVSMVPSQLCECSDYEISSVSSGVFWILSTVK